MEIREASKNQHTPMIDPHDFKVAIDTYRKNSKGIDCWTASELKAMPIEIITSLTALLGY